MTRIPTVSVCIPTHNRAHHLPDAIESILAQTYTDFELVISDNASTDGTLALLNRYTDPRIRVHTNAANLGLVGNFNRCVELARATYVVLCCSDDYWAPQLLEREMALFGEQPDLSFVHVGSVVVSNEKQRICENILTLSAVTPGHTYFSRFLLEDLNGMNFSSVLYRKDRLQGLGGFDVSLPHTQDLAVWTRLALHGDVGYVAEPLVYFRKHQENYHVRWQWPQYWKERLRLVDLIFEEWPEAAGPDFSGLYKEVRRLTARRALQTVVPQRLEGVPRAALAALALLSLRRNPHALWAVGPLKVLAALTLSPQRLRRTIERFGEASRRERRAVNAQHPAS